MGVVPHNRDDVVDHRGLVLGDERTLGEVYDAYAEFVYGVALRVSGDEGVAEDITCGVFVRLWERPYAYDPAQWSMGAWLVAGAHRQAVAQSERGGGDEVPVREADAVVSALAGLAPELREVVELSYFQGLTYRQVAAKLGVGEAVVAARVRAGLRAWAAPGSADRPSASDTGTTGTTGPTGPAGPTGRPTGTARTTGTEEES